MTQLARFSPAPALRSMFENLWSNAMFDDDLIKQHRLPAVNVKQNEKDYEIQVAVPGMKKEDLKINLENGVLTISAETEEEKESKEGQFTRKEFSFNSFQRSFTLPDDVDENSITAHYENGILSLTIGKLHPEKQKRRTISLT
jgi:HSP20 family protein